MKKRLAFVWLFSLVESCTQQALLNAEVVAQKGIPKSSGHFTSIQHHRGMPKGNAGMMQNQTKGAARLRGLVGSVLIVGAAMIALSGCSSGGGSSPTPTPTPVINSDVRDAPTQLFGQWRLVSVSGGITGGGSPFTPGVDFVTFNQNATFSRLEGGQATQGTYKVTSRSTIFSESKAPVITYSTTTLNEIVSPISDTKLVLSDESTDGFVRVYERVSNTAN